MPGKDFLALMLKAGFHRVGMDRYTGCKTSPYTEGALFYGEKLADQKATQDIKAQAEGLTGVLKAPECAPGST